MREQGTRRNGGIEKMKDGKGRKGITRRGRDTKKIEGKI